MLSFKALSRFQKFRQLIRCPVHFDNAKNNPEVDHLPDEFLLLQEFAELAPRDQFDLFVP